MGSLMKTQLLLATILLAVAGSFFFDPEPVTNVAETGGSTAVARVSAGKPMIDIGRASMTPVAYDNGSAASAAAVSR
jgi:hypothetical protein